MPQSNDKLLGRFDECPGHPTATGGAQQLAAAQAKKGGVGKRRVGIFRREELIG